MLRLRRVPMLRLGVLFLALSCGGKTAGDAFDPDGGASQPPPACGTVCAHIVGSCAPGASTADCVAACEKTRDRYMNCAVPLADYLRCAAGTRVNCTPGHVEILDCSAEFNALDACP